MDVTGTIAVAIGVSIGCSISASTGCSRPGTIAVSIGVSIDCSIPGTVGCLHPCFYWLLQTWDNCCLHRCFHWLLQTWDHCCLHRCFYWQEVSLKVSLKVSLILILILSYLNTILNLWQHERLRPLSFYKQRNIEPVDSKCQSGTRKTVDYFSIICYYDEVLSQKYGFIGNISMLARYTFEIVESCRAVFSHPKPTRNGDLLTSLSFTGSKIFLVYCRASAYETTKLSQSFCHRCP